MPSLRSCFAPPAFWDCPRLHANASAERSPTAPLAGERSGILGASDRGRTSVSRALRCVATGTASWTARSWANFCGGSSSAASMSASSYESQRERQHDGSVPPRASPRAPCLRRALRGVDASGAKDSGRETS